MYVIYVSQNLKNLETNGISKLSQEAQIIRDPTASRQNLKNLETNGISKLSQEAQIIRDPTASKFKEFGNQWNFKVITRSPNYPRSNGLAEKGVSITYRLLSITTIDEPYMQDQSTNIV
ncbi:hypothetical protein QE152_g32216 [Popillia japonica]|uniref:Integrase catalytic domain-containing protein n=1 Tax=Popillia japonica TaxID=7064 RepID=A0AAW1IZW0_POPJA